MKSLTRQLALSLAFVCFVLIFSNTLAQAAATPFAQGTAATALTSSEAASNFGVEVPIRLSRTGHFLIPVTLDDDLELPFLLDTAAGRSIITPETCARLKTKPTNKRPMRIEGTGGQLSASLVDLGSFGVGRYRRPQMSAVVLDLKQLAEQVGESFAGILGMDFLKNYDVRVDLERGRLRLRACDEGGDALALVGTDELERVQFRAQQGGLITLRIQLDGASITGLLDTGAARTIMNWKAAEAAGITRATEGVKKHPARYFGVDGNRIELFRYEFRELVIGESRYSPANVSIADLPVFDALGFKGTPAIIIGADFLKARVLLIAQTSGHVYLSRDAETASGEVALNSDDASRAEAQKAAAGSR